MVTIPLPAGLTNYDLQIELDGATFGLELQWNFRESAWYLHLSDADGMPVASGIKIVVDFPLGRRIQDSRMPAGSLWAQDTSGAHQDPGLLDLGQRVQLYYASKGEQP